MTISKAIEKADARRVNAFTPEDKAVWINQVEAAVQRDVMKKSGDSIVYYAYPADRDKPLTLTGEWEELYILWLVAMYDFWSQDTAKYNGSASIYNSMFSEFRKQYRREHPVYSGFTHLV